MRLPRRWEADRRASRVTREIPPVRPRILLTRLSAIGDILFASPLIAVLRRAYPDAHLAWLVQPEYRGLLDQHPDLDEVIECPIGHWRQLWRARRPRALLAELGDLRTRLRRGRFDLVIDLQGLLKSGVLSRLAGAPARIGLGSREGSQWLMTRTIPRGGETKRIGSEYRYLAETLGLAVDDFAMALHHGAAATAAAARLIQAHGLTDGYLVLCPFTTRAQKHWIETRWAELADGLSERFGLTPVLLGGPADRVAAARISARAKSNPLDLTGRTSLTEAGALIARAALLIGVDTGLGHMGIVHGVPSLLLFGATCPYLDTGRPNAQVLYHRLDCSPCKRRPTCDGAYTCMRLIEVEEVIAAARRLLAVAP
ncbi:MAG: glycosyltransferase family 9 protein [Sphingobacteriia bacterium]|nr:glycosyltransferase family 9 protein [Sphingobacteriia bacterium]NCC40041.1 glycosyltransferase family 9 protein [Gammaproteobacteria bacterium]